MLVAARCAAMLSVIWSKDPSIPLWDRVLHETMFCALILSEMFATRNRFLLSIILSAGSFLLEREREKERSCPKEH